MHKKNFQTFALAAKYQTYKAQPLGMALSLCSPRANSYSLF